LTVAEQMLLYIIDIEEQTMNKPSAFFVIIAGLFVTIVGVAGVEASMDDLGLMNSSAVALVGLLSMASGVLGLSQVDSRG